MTIFTQKPVVGSGNAASGAFRCKNVMLKIKWSSLTFTGHLTSSEDVPQTSPSHLNFSLLEKCGGRTPGKQRILSTEVQLGSEDTKAFTEEFLFAKDASRNMLLGDSQSKRRYGISLVVQWLTIHLVIQVRSLVRGLRSHMPWSN